MLWKLGLKTTKSQEKTEESHLQRSPLLMLYIYSEKTLHMGDLKCFQKVPIVCSFHKVVFSVTLSNEVVKTETQNATKSCADFT